MYMCTYIRIRRPSSSRAGAASPCRCASSRRQGNIADSLYHINSKYDVMLIHCYYDVILIQIMMLY